MGSVLVTFVWTISFAIWYAATNNIALAAAASSVEEDLYMEEAKALVQSGWWSYYSNDTSVRCSWDGITCNNVGSIIQIDIMITSLDVASRRNMRDLNFSSFPNLIELGLSLLNLRGNISDQICTLSNLERLDLSENSLSVKLPYCLENLTKLIKLYLYSNNLVNLHLEYNNLTGPIPQEIGNLQSLAVISLSYNDLSGQIPSSFGQLTSLTDLDLSDNKLSGAIPSSIGQLTSLNGLYLSNNKLSCAIPSSIGQLTSLNGLYLSNNNLSGAISSSNATMTYITYLDLSYNNLSGSISRFIKHMDSSFTVDVSGNPLMEESPPEYVGSTGPFRQNMYSRRDFYCPCI